LGDYARAFEGAYFAQVLNEARQQGRIGKVSADPILPIRLFWDIGGAGAKSRCVRDMGRAVGRAGDPRARLHRGPGPGARLYTNELRHRGYDKAICVLPHDGVNTNMVTGLRYADHLRDAEFKVEVIPNQGAGAAAMRIEAVRRIFPKVWFNEATTEAGRDALGFYHAKKDEGRDVDLGPEHDWSSHAADSFGLMAIAYKEPSASARFNRQLEFPNARAFV
jgi:phage terminase large subunit